MALRAGGEAVLIDSPYLPDELDALPSLLAGAGYEPDGLIATHGDFDHLLGRRRLPGHGARHGGADGTLRRGARRGPAPAAHYDQDFYIERTAPLALGQVPVAARAGPARPRQRVLDAIEIELHASEGHTRTAWRCSSAWGAGRRLRLAGRDPLDPRARSPDYRSTLRRLRRSSRRPT